jgi:hypothetical protein
METNNIITNLQDANKKTSENQQAPRYQYLSINDVGSFRRLMCKARDRSPAADPRGPYGSGQVSGLSP